MSFRAIKELRTLYSFCIDLIYFPDRSSMLPGDHRSAGRRGILPVSIEPEPSNDKMIDVPGAETASATAGLAGRRRLLRAGLATVALPWAASVPAAATLDSAAPLPDLDDPAQHLRAYVRMRGSADGSLVAEVTQGYVYALLPSGRPRLLWQSRGFQLSRYRQEADGAWNCRSNYFGTFADAASGAPIGEWHNPFTGRRDALPPTVYGPMDYVLTASRTLVKPTAAERAAALAERGVRRWTRTGDLVSILDELGPPGDPAKPPDLDLVTLSARAADLANPALASVPSQTAFGAVEPWREWMRMESRPGMLLWHLQGTKLRDVAELPEELVRVAEARRPGFVAGATK